MQGQQARRAILRRATFGSRAQWNRPLIETVVAPPFGGVGWARPPADGLLGPAAERTGDASTPGFGDADDNSGEPAE